MVVGVVVVVMVVVVVLADVVVVGVVVVVVLVDVVAVLAVVVVVVGVVVGVVVVVVDVVVDWHVAGADDSAVSTTLTRSTFGPRSSLDSVSDRRVTREVAPRQAGATKDISVQPSAWLECPVVSKVNVSLASAKSTAKVFLTGGPFGLPAIRRLTRYRCPAVVATSW